jgi:hypothetical protein
LRHNWKAIPDKAADYDPAGRVNPAPFQRVAYARRMIPKSGNRFSGKIMRKK